MKDHKNWIRKYEEGLWISQQKWYSSCLKNTKTTPFKHSMNQISYSISKFDFLLENTLNFISMCRLIHCWQAIRIRRVGKFNRMNWLSCSDHILRF